MRGRAAETAAMNVDLPAFGKPTRPTSASSRSSSRRSTRFAGKPGLDAPGRAVGRAHEAHVAASAAPAAPRPRPRVRACRDRRAARPLSASRMRVPTGTRTSLVVAGRRRAGPCPARARRVRPRAGAETEVEQGVEPGIGDEHDVPAAPAVAADRPAIGLVLLAQERHAAAPPSPAVTDTRLRRRIS